MWNIRACQNARASFIDYWNAFSLLAMEVGVFDSADYVNNTKMKLLTFPNYSDPAFTEKWKNMGDSVAFPVDELPSEGKENNIHILTCIVYLKKRPKKVAFEKLNFSK